MLGRQIEPSTREQAELAFGCQLFLAGQRGCFLRPNVPPTLIYLFSAGCRAGGWGRTCTNSPCVRHRAAALGNSFPSPPPRLPLLNSWSCSLLGSNATAALGPGGGPASKNNPLSAQYPLYLFIYFKLDPFPDQTRDRVSCGGSLGRGRWHFPAQALDIPAQDGLVGHQKPCQTQSRGAEHQKYCLILLKQQRLPELFCCRIAWVSMGATQACSVWWTGPCYYVPITSCIQGTLKSIADVCGVAYRLTDPS